MILAIKHIDIEGPGSIAEYLSDAARLISIIDISKGGTLPKDFKYIEAIISLGGPMNVYEEEKYPFLKQEDIFIKKALLHKIPFLGICLGSQLLAKATGAKVTKSPQQEIGWSQVNLTDAGKKDPLFQNLPDELKAFQWHEDMFEIPPNGVLLALSESCPHQAFRVGESAYGLQFHVEVTPKIVDSWIAAYAKDDAKSPVFENIRSEFLRIEQTYAVQARQMYVNFFNVSRS